MWKNKTKWLVIIAITTLTSPCFGQQDWSRVRHELRLGIGAIPLTSVTFFVAKDDSPSPADYVNFYKGDKTYTPAVNLTYSYQFKKWLSFGATLTYAGIFQNRYDIISDKLRGEYRSLYIGLTPTVRFDYLNREMVRLYSAFGLGLGYNREYNSELKENYSLRNDDFFPTLDMTFIGVTVGRKLYGFGEVGIGHNGLIKLGMGYRFNLKKQR